MVGSVAPGGAAERDGTALGTEVVANGVPLGGGEELFPSPRYAGEAVGCVKRSAAAPRLCSGVGFAGAKGFAGGFGRGTLGAWGERALKLFVQEAVDEALKLESALARLRTASRVAVLHYSPVRGTVEGEPPEIFPFLGCSRL